MIKNCSHTGPHRVMINGRFGGDASGRTIGDYVAMALDHAVDHDEDKVSRAREVLRSAAETRRPVGDGMVDLGDDDFVTLYDATESARDYMAVNNYAGDGDFPDDRGAALALENGNPLICFTSVP